MRIIWKYPIDVQDGIIEVLMPKDAEVIHVGTQYDIVCLWVIVDTERHGDETKRFRIHGTGHPLANNTGTPYSIFDTYLGTVQTCNGKFVWHIFEVK